MSDLMTVDGFNKWVSTAKPGDNCPYFSGFTVTDSSGSRTHGAARAAWAAYLNGLVNLVQRRLSDLGRFEYIAQRRENPR